MDLTNITEVYETCMSFEVNERLSRKDEQWVLLCVSPGQDIDRSPYVKYSLGRVFSFSDLAKDPADS